MHVLMKACGAFLTLGYLALVGCESTNTRQETPWTLVSVSDVSTVAGKWEGLLRRMPPTKQDDWVTLVIQPDGRYEFVSVRTIGAMSGQGEFTTSDGKLTTSSERGSIEAALYETGGHRMLRTKARGADGTQYFSDLKQAK